MMWLTPVNFPFLARGAPSGNLVDIPQSPNRETRAGVSLLNPVRSIAFFSGTFQAYGLISQDFPRLSQARYTLSTGFHFQRIALNNFSYCPHNRR